MSWLLWLAPPVVATMLAACWSWWGSRPEATRSTTQSVQDHNDYLDALVQTARSKDSAPCPAPLPPSVD